MGRLACSTLLVCLIGSSGLVVSALSRPAQAQVSVISELWREWAVLQRQLRDARDEVARERARLRKRKARKAREAAQRAGGKGTDE